TFTVGLALNILIVFGQQSYVDRIPLLKQLREDLTPVMSAELASATLTVVAAYLTESYHEVGLLLFALVLVIFQYLVRELLLSQRRGQELEIGATTDDLTGLANRKQFGDYVDAAIAATAGTPATFA